MHNTKVEYYTYNKMQLTVGLITKRRYHIMDSLIMNYWPDRYIFILDEYNDRDDHNKIKNDNKNKDAFTIEYYEHGNRYNIDHEVLTISPKHNIIIGWNTSEFNKRIVPNKINDDIINLHNIPFHDDININDYINNYGIDIIIHDKEIEDSIKNIKCDRLAHKILYDDVDIWDIEAMHSLHDFTKYV